MIYDVVNALSTAGSVLEWLTAAQTGATVRGWERSVPASIVATIVAGGDAENSIVPGPLVRPKAFVF